MASTEVEMGAVVFSGDKKYTVETSILIYGEE